MKKILFIAFIACFFCSCTTFIHTGSEYNLWFAIKKIDGKEQWGVVQDRHVVGFRNNDKAIGYLRLSQADKELGWPDPGYGIGVKYDSIKFVDFYSQKMFFAYKDGKNYYYSEGLTYYAHEHPVERLEYISPGRSKCFNNQIEAKFYLADGTVYTTDRGPVEDINVGFYGYALKKNGKWGYYFGRRDIKTSDKRFVQTVPFDYDEIIESLDMKWQNHLVLARKGNVWDTYNRSGEKLPTDVNILNEALSRRKKSGNVNPDFFIYDRK